MQVEYIVPYFTFGGDIYEPLASSIAFYVFGVQPADRRVGRRVAGILSGGALTVLPEKTSNIKDARTGKKLPEIFIFD